MQLSVIIVNYNVKFFLEQCLQSVEKASSNIDAETIVVDNNSVDGSCNIVKQKFPWVKLIENKSNVGFAKANNQAIKIASGKYILLLNPDTVVEENTFRLCIDFMEKKEDTGALCVKMIDGSGNFLPESKRALPSPTVAFCKIFGLSSLFPKSKIFGRYHLGYLDNDEINEIDILPGAFMFIRKKALDQTGLLDENFFMYGEDIDLSYRIKKAGFKNYYFPKTTIIHYKGESTKKSSMNYVRVFYNAMIIFAKKHFSQKNAKLFSLLINFAIYFRALIAILHRFVKAILLPLTDTLLLYFMFYLLEPLWAYIKFGENSYYPKEFLFIAVPLYIVVWITSIFFAGGYDKPIKIINLIKGLTVGTLIILIIYSLLPEDFRFSRFLIITGAIGGYLLTIIARYFFYFLKLKIIQIDLNRKKKIAIVGNEADCKRIQNIINKSDIKFDFIGNISVDNDQNSTDYIGSISQLDEIIQIHKIDELIFSGNDLSSQQIINLMLSLSDRDIDFKIAPSESLSIIGSNSIHTTGDLYLLNLNSIAKAQNKRNKRTLDIILSIALIVFIPVLIFFFKKPGVFLKNLFNVLIGRYSWVGYHPGLNHSELDLPNIKKGVLNPSDKFKNRDITTDLNKKINLVYAKNYKIINDLETFYYGFHKLDRFYFV